MATAPSIRLFRRATLRTCRIFSGVVPVACIVAGFDALGIFGEGEWPEPSYTLSVVFLFGAVFAWSSRTQR
jgi:hypothetical protein